MQSPIAVLLTKAASPLAVVLCCGLAWGQGNFARPGPVRLPGVITDPGFPAILAGSIQGTYPPAGGMFRNPGLGSYGGGFLLSLAPPFSYPPVPPPAPVTVFNISNEPPVPQQFADLPPAPAPAEPPPAPEPVVTVIVATPDRQETSAPVNSPELARRNAQNLQALAAALRISEPADEASPAGISAAPFSRGTEPLLLIALKDHNVVTAIACWTDHGALRYVTPAREQKQVPLDEVDMDRSRALNDERGMSFRVMP